jgi:hypothetical protein
MAKTKTRTKRITKPKYEPVLKLPPVRYEDFVALRDNIAVNGVLVPILVDSDGPRRRIIDGNYRKQISEELGYDCPEIVQPNLADEEKRTLARALNLARRQFTQEQKRELIADQLEETPERSNRWVAKQLGVHHATVGSVRGELQSGGQIIHLNQRVGQDGKSYPTAKEYWRSKQECSDHPLTLYPTPASVTEALLNREKFAGPILEPASGDNAMVTVLRRHGYKVIAQDIKDGHDFLLRKSKVANIVTNPPYALSMAEAFVRHAMSIAITKIAMLVPFYFLEGVGRHELFAGRLWPVKAVYVLSRRPTFGSQNGPAPFGSLWIVWERGFRGSTKTEWILD